MIKHNLTGKRIDRPTTSPGSSPPGSAADRVRGKLGKGSSFKSALKSQTKTSGKPGRGRSASPKGRVAESKPSDMIHSEETLCLILRTAESNFMQGKVEKASAHRDRLKKLLNLLETN
jgi:hypothetical protein